MRYRVFKRSWWKENKDGTWPNGLEPCPGKRRYIRGAVFDTEEEARDFCKQRNAEPRTARETRLDFMYEYEGR